MPRSYLRNNDNHLSEFKRGRAFFEGGKLVLPYESIMLQRWSRWSQEGTMNHLSGEEYRWHECIAENLLRFYT